MRTVTRLGFNIPYRGARRPEPPVAMNRDSWQSHGLAHWWPLMEEGIAKDHAGAVHLTRFSGASLQIGGDSEFHRAADFDGSSTGRYNTLGGQIAEDLLGTPPCSVSLWFSKDVGNTDSLFSIADRSDNSTFINIQSRSGGEIRVISDSVGDTGVNAETTTSLALNTWGHCGAVYAAINDRRAYLNGGGEDIGTDSRTVTLLDRVGIGYLADSSPSSYINGQITDVRYYRRALSATEVAALADKHTRWELYHPLNRRSFFFADVVGEVPSDNAVRMASYRRRRFSFC